MKSLKALDPTRPIREADILICALSASRGRVGERTADPLHSAGVNAKTLGNAAYTLTSPPTLVQRRLDALHFVMPRL